jgi:soluble lytic murein transglycosylase-like protein
VNAVPDSITVDQPSPDALDLDGQAASEPCNISDRFPQTVMQWCSLITHYANKRGLHPDLVASLILQESGGNAQAYSKSGAVGLMQVMPNDGLSSSFMCQAGPCFSNRPSTAELQDPEFNIAYGTKLLADLQARYGDIREALKSYGPMNVGYYYADIVLGILQNYGN